MRTLKLALAAAAAFAINANAQVPKTGLAAYQPPVIAPTFAPNSQAFHAGGVASCDGCHVMHNAAGGVAKSTAVSAVSPWTNVTNMFLLQGTDQSSTCLICHGGEGAGTATQFTVFDNNGGVPANRTPGGDFAWVLQDWRNSPADRHGHNVAAADFGLAVDGDLATAPGGAWTSGPGKRQFACTSCHDPHGRYRLQTAATASGVAVVGPTATGALPAGSLPIATSGSYGDAPVDAQYAVGVYRLLGGRFYAPASNPSSPFANDPPVAVAPPTYNASEAANDVKVAYGTGMSEWCQNCHGNIHLNNYSTGVAGLRHPAGSDARLHSPQISAYNTYVSSGKIDTNLTSRYTSLVPFEQGKDLTLAALRASTAVAATIPATVTSNVMCLSCHRAHASAFDSVIRWDQNATFLTDDADFTSGITGAAGAGIERPIEATRAGYYDRAVGTGANNIGPYQRSLCNKCHAKD